MPVIERIVERTPLKKYGGQIPLDLDGYSVAEALERLEALTFPDGCIETRIDVSSDDGWGEVVVAWYRMETPEEVETRVALADARAATQRQNRLMEYNRLKQEFEGQGNA